MSAPSLRPGYCVVCGRPYPTGHHVVRRSRGGRAGPILDLCEHGTKGCHGDAERLCLHFRYREGWEYLRTSRPPRYAEALSNLREAFDDYITWALAEGLRIPEPARGLMRTPRATKSTTVPQQVLPGASVAPLTSEASTSGPEIRRFGGEKVA